MLRRLFVRLRAGSLAILLERRFPTFQDSLVTAVELSGTEEPSALHQEMLSHARVDAVRQIKQVPLDEVFNRQPLWRVMGVAIALVTSIVVFGVMASGAFATWTQRMYGLSDEPWPRRAHIEVIGLTNNEVKIARGADFAVRVRADAEREIPDVCTIHYRSSDGEAGRVNMNKPGLPRDGHQFYTFEGRPFQGILADLWFDVVGFDHRVRDCHILVVESPKVINVDLSVDFPEYTGLLPRAESYRPGIQLPRGSSLSLSISTNKPLQEATISGADGEPTRILLGEQPDSETFRFELPVLDDDVQLAVDLLDRDGVTSQQSYRLYVTAVEDQPPLVTARLRGIGTAVTAAARIPAEGDVTDDFGVERVWFQLHTDNDMLELPVSLVDGERLDAALDLRTLTDANDQSIGLAAGQQIAVTIRAADRYDLDANANIGEGDRYELDVVSPERLLALLEAREVDLGRRFDQMISEMTETRDSLLRVKTSKMSAVEPGDTAEPAETIAGGPGEKEKAYTPDWLRLASLLVQRAAQHSERAAEEVRSVALSFDDISEELTNNRIDSEDRKGRLKNDISSPLKRIADVMLPNLSAQLQTLQVAQSKGDFADEADHAVLLADDVVSEMEKVREKMLDLETYNELLDFVRSLIDQQKEVSARTKKLQKQEALELLE